MNINAVHRGKGWQQNGGGSERVQALGPEEREQSRVSQENQSPCDRRTLLYLWRGGDSVLLWPHTGGQWGCGEQYVSTLWSRLTSLMRCPAPTSKVQWEACRYLWTVSILTLFLCTYTYTDLWGVHKFQLLLKDVTSVSVSIVINTMTKPENSLSLRKVRTEAQMGQEPGDHGECFLLVCSLLSLLS